MTKNNLNEENLTNEEKLKQEEIPAEETSNAEATASNSARDEEADTENKNVESEPNEESQTDPLEEAKIEIGELKDKYIRLYAEFENYRRRTAKEKLDLISTATSGLLKSLLPVVDDFERAIASFEALKSPEMDAFKEGVELIYSKLMRTLENEGLKVMEIENSEFNSDFHESVAQFPASSEEQKGKVVEVLEKGYFLNDKVIRYAKVVVGV
jgi:molecular chaperone GrpE